MRGALSTALDLAVAGGASQVRDPGDGVTILPLGFDRPGEAR